MVFETLLSTNLFRSIEWQAKVQEIVNFYLTSTMHKTLDYSNHPELDARSSNRHSSSSIPWWCGTGQNDFLSDVCKERKTEVLGAKFVDCELGFKSSKSQAKDQSDEGTGADKDMQLTAVSQSYGKCGEDNQHEQLCTSIVSPPVVEDLTPATNLELVGHSIACTTHPFSDSLYGGTLPACGPQVHPQFLGMHHARMVLPLDVTQEPVYVNAKQYHGILRRRQSRAKAELAKKLINVRKPYLHESRHLHAMRRARGCGGRFLNTKKLEGNAANAVTNKSANPGETVSRHSTHSSSSGTVPSNISSNADSPTGDGEVIEPHSCGMHLQQTYSSGNGNAFYSLATGFPFSAYRFFSDRSMERGGL